MYESTLGMIIMLMIMVITMIMILCIFMVIIYFTMCPVEMSMVVADGSSCLKKSLIFSSSSELF